MTVNLLNYISFIAINMSFIQKRYRKNNHISIDFLSPKVGSKNSFTSKFSEFFRDN